MYSPICDKVELERPLLKNTYNEIMDVFDDAMKTVDVMSLKRYPYAEAVVNAYSDMINAYNNHEDCKKKYREAVFKEKEFKLFELGEEGTTAFLNKYFSGIFINTLIYLGFIKRDRHIYTFNDRNGKEVRIVTRTELLKYLYLHENETIRYFLKNLEELENKYENN